MILQLTAAQAPGMDLDNRNVLKAGIETKSHEADKEESKDEIQSLSTGGKRR